MVNVNITSCRNLSENQLVCLIKKLFIKGFKTFWFKHRKKNINAGKLDTYFRTKKEFIAEPYLMLEHFYLRKAICKLRLSAHYLLIETGRSVKPKSIPRSARICKHCTLNLIENKFHILSQCSLYEPGKKLYDHIQSINSNFVSLYVNDKALWLLI